MTKPGRITRRDTLLKVIERIRQVLAYGRVSSDIQRETETIRIQQLKLLDGIKVRDNPALPDRDRLQLAGEYWDDGVSGTIPLEKRPDGQHLVQFICRRGDLSCKGDCDTANVADELWITKLDRLARRLQILISIEAFLKAHGVALISLDFGINTSTPVGRLIFAVLGAIAEWERDVIVERTTGGKHHKAAQGKWVGGRYPLGFTVDDDGYLVVDDTLVEATGEMAHQLVQGIFENVALHSKTAWSEGVRTGLGAERVLWILHQRRYKGEGGLLAGDGRWIASEGRQPPQLVEPWIWDLAQEKLLSNSKNSSRNRHYDYLLTGGDARILTCREPFEDGVCGRTFAGRSEKRHGHKANYVYYYCSRRGCTAKMLRGTDLEDAVWQEVQAVLRDPRSYLEEARKHHAANNLIGQLRGELTGAINRLAALSTERQAVLRSSEKGLRPEEEADIVVAGILKEVAEVQAQRAALEVQLRSAAVVSEDDRRAAIVSADLAITLDDITATDDRAKKRELIQAVVRSAEVRTRDGRAEVRLLLRIGAELLIDPSERQQAPGSAQQHEPLIVVREITLPRHRPGPNRGAVRRPDVAARNVSRWSLRRQASG